MSTEFVKAVYKTSKSLQHVLRYFERDDAKIANFLPIMVDLVLDAFENGQSTNTGLLKAELGNTVLLYIFGRFDFDGTSRNLKSSIPDSALALYYLNFANSNMSFWRIRKSTETCDSLCSEEKNRIYNCLNKCSR